MWSFEKGSWQLAVGSWQDRWPRFLSSLRIFCCLLLTANCLLLLGCRQDMHDQPKYQAYKEDGMRHPVEGTVARGSLNLTRTAAPAGMPGAARGGDTTFPFSITAEVLTR